MSHAYNEKAQEYLDFLSSENGQIQQGILSAAIFKHLPQGQNSSILDVACGPGWLTKKLYGKYPNVQGCDISAEFIEYARQHYPGIEFKTADLTERLPYPENSFHALVCNMALVDVADLQGAYKNLYTITQPAGKLIVTLPNPYYTFPVGVWKRGLLGRLLGWKPALKIQNAYNRIAGIVREFNGHTISSHFYPLEDYLNCARTAGFRLVKIQELRSEKDSPSFNLRYQMYRYPLLVLLEFMKPVPRVNTQMSPRNPHPGPAQSL